MDDREMCQGRPRADATFQNCSASPRARHHVRHGHGVGVITLHSGHLQEPF